MEVMRRERAEGVSPSSGSSIIPGYGAFRDAPPRYDFKN